MASGPVDLAGIRGRVTDTSDGTAISGARVAWVPDSAAVVSNARLAYVETDAFGRFSLGPSEGGGAALLVTRTGYTSALLTSPLPVEEVVVQLTRGLEIRGVVVTPEGTPVAGVRIVAAPAGADGRWSYPDDWVGRDVVRAGAVVATSAEDGRFTLAGLPTGHVRLRSSKLGWRPLEPASPPPRSRPEESLPLVDPTTTYAAAGSSNVRIVMRPVCRLSLEAVDADSGAVLRFAQVKLQDVRVVGGQTSSNGWVLAGFDAGDWPTTSKFAVERCVPETWFELPTDAADAAGARIRVAALGYEPVDTQIRPRGPDDLEYMQPQRVSLRRKAEMGTASIALRLGGSPYREPIALRIAEPGTRTGGMYLLGGVDSDGFYRIDLPAGAYQVALGGAPFVPTMQAQWIPLSVSPRRETLNHVDVDAGVLDVHVRSEMGGSLPGARLRITAAAGGAIHSVLVVPPSGRALFDSPDVLVALPIDGTFRVIVAPGDYRLSAGCFGFVDSSWDRISVSSGVIAPIDLALKPEENR